MNGHCEFHIFEQAVDVCGLCFGDLCGSCALTLSGRRDTICKECALTISGVRGSGRIEFRGDRRTRKQRKAAYATAGPKDAYFRFFDQQPNEPATAEAEAGAGHEVDREEPAADQDRRRKTGSAGLRRIFGRRKTDRPVPDSHSEEFISISSVLGSEHDDTDGAQPNDADAVSQLADIRRRSPDFAPPRLRQADVPDQPQPDEALLDPSHSDGGQSDKADQATVHDHASSTDEAENPFLKRGQEAPPAVPHADLTTDPFAQPAQDETARPESARPVAAEDDAELEGDTSPDRADVDERGLWIPPILRGIAEDAAEAASELPRRRRG